MKEVGISCQLWGKEQAEGVAEPQASVRGESVSQQRMGGELLDPLTWKAQSMGV